jgi:hypothetical protein
MTILSLKNYVNVPYLQKEMARKFFFIVFCWCLGHQWSMTKIAGSGAGSVPICHGSMTITLLKSYFNFEQNYQNRPAASVTTFTCRT